jgi:hypothetical protein
MEKNVIAVASVLGIQSPSGLQLIHGNRTVTDLKHVAKIKEAMKRGEIVPPIIIDKLTKLIIDGQHRFMAACELWREGNSYILSYLEFEFENPLLSAIQYNSNSKKWSTADYVKAYIVDGRESYDILHKFCQSHEHFRGGRNGFQYKAAAQLITGQACGDAIQRGILQITEEQAKVADIAYNQLAQMAAAIGKERGGLTLLKRDIVLAWLGVRGLILSNMTIDAFTNLMKKHFVCPISDKKVLYQSMYLDVYKSKK